MNEIKWEVFFAKLDYYVIALSILALLALLGYFLSIRDQKNNLVVSLCFWIVALIAFYENLGGFLASQKMTNLWVYNLFNSHLTTILFFLLIRSFLKRKIHKMVVYLLIGIFLLISAILHVLGIAEISDTGEYISFVNTVLILCCCGLFFFELMTLNEFLDSNPLREFSFWACTSILFYFSSSFMVYISFKYLYTNHLDIYYMVIEIPKQMTLYCCILLCIGIYSPMIKNRFQIEIIHV